MGQERLHDLIIVGGGIGGVISLKYARDAGFDAVLLERSDAVGGLWRDLPNWQDIQLRKEDWTLGDLPIAGEDQPSILANIRAWVDRFGLAPAIRLGVSVTSARPVDGAWQVDAEGYSARSKFLIAATGGHNLPHIPKVERVSPTVTEYHASALRDPTELAGKDVVVVGAGASAFDLLDMCFAQHARRVVWTHRTLKWMRPTRQPKYFGSDIRFLAKMQMLGVRLRTQNKWINQDLQARYKKAGLEDLMPETPFDLANQLLLPGRRGMIENVGQIVRHRAEIVSIEGDMVRLSTGTSVRADLVLWGTGYQTDMRYLAVPALSNITRLEDIRPRLGAHFLALDAPNLFILAPGVLETNSAAPWAYAHAAKSIMAHIRGRSVFEPVPVADNVNYFDLARFLARRDRSTYRYLLWYLKYLKLALRQPADRPMPLP